MSPGDLEIDTIKDQKNDELNIATIIDRHLQRVATLIYES